MKCIEVVVNNGEPVLVGSRDASLLSGSLVLPASGSGGILFSARTATTIYSGQTLSWAFNGLNRGDEVRIRIVEAAHASPPTAMLDHGEAVAGSATHGCSICCRERDEVEKLVATGHFSICGQCIELAYEAIHGTNSSEA